MAISEGHHSRIVARPCIHAIILGIEFCSIYTNSHTHNWEAQSACRVRALPSHAFMTVTSRVCLALPFLFHVVNCNFNVTIVIVGHLFTLSNFLLGTLRGKMVCRCRIFAYLFNEKLNFQNLFFISQQVKILTLQWPIAIIKLAFWIYWSRGGGVGARGAGKDRAGWVCDTT